MWINYLKVAWRNLLKSRTYAAINILGMSLGIAVCVLIFLFVKDERSFDTFHENGDRIYRAWVKEYFKGDVFFNSTTPYLLGTELANNFPEIENVVRYVTINSLIKESEEIDPINVHLVDTAFFQVFDFPLLHGSTEVLSNRYSAVITPDIALRHFGEEAPLGRTLTLQVGGEWKDYSVDAIIAPPPSNSSLQYGVIIPFENTLLYMSEGGRKCWTCVSVETYLMINTRELPADFENNVAVFMDKQVADIYEPGEYVVGFQPLTDIHLNNAIPQGIVQVSDPRYPYILSGIALLILLLACINFTTISLGKSVSRSREVGIRKVSGASRQQIMWQFWSEAFLTVAISLGFGLIIAKLALPFFNGLAGKSLAFSYDATFVLSMLVLLTMTALLAGAYPALVVSGFRPVTALKTKLSRGTGTRIDLLKYLVGFQFILSVTLLICTGVMRNQMRFLQNKNLGFDDAVALTFDYDVSGQNLSDTWTEGERLFKRLKDDLSQKVSIDKMALSSHVFGQPGWLKLGYTDRLDDRFKQFYALYVDEEFLPMMDIELTDGRFFQKENATDKMGVIINASMVKAFDLSDPVGKYLPEPFEDFRIIGVTEDFHYESLHHQVEPLVMVYDLLAIATRANDVVYTDSPNPKITVKLAAGQIQQSIRDVEKSWKTIAPDQSFDYAFIDDQVARQYESESRLSAVLTWATGFALLIACLGLFGISAMKIAFKTKEIGIRKVLGAESSGILLWLARDYMWLVMTASLIAIPLAWWVMQRWMQDFAFSAGIQWWTFALAVIIVALVSVGTVGFQSLRAAWSNPVNVLRND